MPYSAEHKQQSRERILHAAVDLFCRKGFDSVSITQIMQHAQMTHGAFYAHFDSKVSLYAEAISHAAQHSLLVRAGKVLTKDKLIVLVKQYLSLSHVRQEDYPCPLAFLSTDVAHRDAQVRASYEAVFKGMVARLAKALEIDNISDQQAVSRSQSLVVTLVGTVAIARNLADSQSQQSLLDNAQQGLIEMMFS